MKMKHLRILLNEEGDDENSPANLATKIVSIFVFLGMAMAFGLMPYYIKRFRTSTKFLSISNAFSGGLFLGIGLFHVLPESAEKLKEYELPWAYFCAYISYALILFVEKVAFNSHSLLHGHGNSHKEPRISVEPLPNLNNSGRQSNIEGNEGNEEHLIGKEVEKEEKNEKEDNEQEHEHDEHEHEHFEGMALGIQGKVRDTLFLSLAIAAHKWAASLTLGISIIKSGIKLKQLVIMIAVFGLIGPVGIAFGMILKATANEIVEAIFLAISVGTFLYIACTEVLVEEFEHSDYKYFKFVAFIIGGIFTAGLSLIEAFTGIEG